ncbi:MAG: hypothetical protein D3908_11150 [Candidatus Electrothrix sp. AUS4]|nr:hypothetical protein [Candidatus Electrothrix sp. AUS4]
MKGVIATCLAGLVRDRFGQDKWEAALEDAGMDRHAIFFATSQLDDATFMKIVMSVCKILKITPLQSAEAFGEYWMNEYAPRIYGVYLQEASSARELLLNMDKIHETVTSTISDSQPPRFDYEWTDSNTLLMQYNSHRGLIDFFVGLVKGVGTYFQEELVVNKLSDTEVEIVFPKEAPTSQPTGPKQQNMII